MCKVSVVITAHNSSRYISNAIDSLTNQTFDKDFEIILIDDSSTDNCEELLAKYEKKSAKLTYKSVNFASPLLSRLEGVKLAKGDYIMFLDADDEYSKNMIQVMYETIVRESADIVNCGITYLRNKNREKKSIISKNATYDRLGAFKTLLNDYSFHGFVTTKIYKADLFNSIKINLPQDNLTYEDYFLNYLLIMECDKVVSIKDQLFRYNKRNNETQIKLTRRITDQVAVNAFIRNDLEKDDKKEYLNYFLKPKIHFRKWASKLVDILMAKYDSKEQKKEIEAIAKKDLKYVFKKKGKLNLDQERSYYKLIKNSEK